MLNVVSSDWREIATEDLRLLETVGDMLGIAIERARLFDRSAELGAVEERNRLGRKAICSRARRGKRFFRPFA